MLASAGVDVKGCVAVARRGGGMSRNAVVVKAAEKGVAAVVMYTENKGGGVERGTVLEGVGDPLTPGWGGDGERLGVEDDVVLKRFPAVASLPISADTAEMILGSLEGPHLWSNRVGPGPTFLNFTYKVCFLIILLDHLFIVLTISSSSFTFK